MVTCRPLRSFRPHQLLGSLFHLAGRRHCLPVPQMALACPGDAEGSAVGWQTSRRGRKGPGAQGTPRLWLTHSLDRQEG